MSDLGFDAGGSGYAKEDRLVNWERDDTKHATQSPLLAGKVGAFGLGKAMILLELKGQIQKF